MVLGDMPDVITWKVMQVCERHFWCPYLLQQMAAKRLDLMTAQPHDAKLERAELCCQPVLPVPGIAPGSLPALPVPGIVPGSSSNGSKGPTSRLARLAGSRSELPCALSLQPYASYLSLVRPPTHDREFETLILGGKSIGRLVKVERGEKGDLLYNHPSNSSLILTIANVS